MILFNTASKLADESDNLELIMKDPIQYPMFVSQYNNVGEIRNNSIMLVDSNDSDRYVDIDAEDMYLYTSD